ncbi:MAG: dihydrofolate reductase family protein [Saprospiraceae bacterium]|nr:dihydrofolate reductase family protein [Saprospiraceae bacterium]
MNALNKRKVFLYISMSLDGYLAGPEDDISWLSIAEQEGEDYGYAAFTKGIDTYIVGRKTYEVVLNLIGDFPAARQYDACYVLTTRSFPEREGITWYNGSPSELLRDIRRKSGKHIYCDGGASVVKAFLEEGLIDEYIISILPILLGKGKRLFQEGFPKHLLKLKETKTFASGLVQLHYTNKPS